MIPEYKLYHGAVLAELVDRLQKSLAIDELVENGRLTSYVLDGKVGMHIKHSMSKLTPWQFTFTPGNISELGFLQMTHRQSYVVFVCHTDGMVCLTVEEVNSLLSFGQGDQASIRVSRHRNELYSVSSGTAELPRKRAEGVGLILESLAG
jgi:hypothetical protein